VQLVDSMLSRPRHCLADGSCGVVVGKEPCGRSGQARGAAGIDGRGGVLDLEVMVDDRVEADVEQC
jgi:hypothetical protein